MTAREIAAAIRAACLPVLRVEAADEDVDASVFVTPKIYVQIPTFGGHPNVVREGADAQGVYWFNYPERATVDELVKDLRVAVEVRS